MDHPLLTLEARQFLQDCDVTTLEGDEAQQAWAAALAGDSLELLPC